MFRLRSPHGSTQLEEQIVDAEMRLAFYDDSTRSLTELDDEVPCCAASPACMPLRPHARLAGRLSLTAIAVAFEHACLPDRTCASPAASP